ncbi:hypothetical protein ASF57_12645 [Methylobacterium sp. Leaf117]|nr:hypothetical protein ASF57_12645 [Methylobacterium sp. Leaf117]
MVLAEGLSARLFLICQRRAFDGAGDLFQEQDPSSASCRVYAGLLLWRRARSRDRFFILQFEFSGLAFEFIQIVDMDESWPAGYVFQLSGKPETFDVRDRAPQAIRRFFLG